jgi:hypothetical protein
MKKRSLWLVMLWTGCDASEPIEPPIDPVIALHQAGESRSESERLEHLRIALSAIPSGDPMRFEVLDLIEVAEHLALGRSQFWVPGEQERAGEGGYLCAFFTDRVWPASYGDIYPAEPRLDSPTRALWSLFRGRLMIWQGLEHGIAVDELFAEGRTLIEAFAQAHPNHPDALLYLGQGIPWVLDLPSDAQAPEWALLQREALVRLDEILRFWVEERQAPDGQFGGGWGDDVELWRRWTPLLLGFKHKRLQDAQALLTQGIFALERLANGYTEVMSDVEHSAEDTGDTLTLALLIDPQSAFARPKAARLGVLARALWMAPNVQNQLQFRSSYFTATRVDDSSNRACDTAYHVRALQPLVHLWRQGDVAAGNLLSEWLETWRSVSLNASNGKPAGIIPSSIRYPSGEAGGSGSDWWNPGCHITTKTFAWPRAVSMIAQTMVVAAQETGDLRFLEPLTAMVEFWRQRQHLADRNAAKGSEARLTARIPGLVSAALSHWRAATDDSQFDDLLDHSESTYARSNRLGEDAAVLQGLRDAVAALSVDYAAQTREVLFTDRFLKFHRNYADQFRDQALARLDLDLLYGMLTGAVTGPTLLGNGPMRWNLPVDDLAVWVRRSPQGGLRIELYAFAGEATRSVEASIMDPALRDRNWSVECAGQTLATGRGAPSFDLPRTQVCELQFSAP